MKVKILTSKQAEELGLKEKSKKRERGLGEMGASTTIKRNKITGVDKVVEKQLMYSNGKKEIIFMSKDRVEYLKSQNDYINYMKQFNKISGVEK